MDEKPRRRYLKHEVPSWIFDGNTHPAFFITICCKKRGVNQLASEAIWNTMLEAILKRQTDGIWICTLFVAMPDHIHAVIRFEGEKNMPLAVRGWKRWIATQCKIEWQRGFFDHRLRSQESAAQKRAYILNNPVRAGLVDKPEDWRYIWDMSG